MIEKIIWQTYESEFNDLPDYIKVYPQTWIDNNPNWKYRYMSAKDRENFVLNEFGPKWHNFFINLPLNILRADLWRYMVVYKYGGIYVDLDMVCYKSIDSWLDDKYDLVIFDEIPPERLHDDIMFCQNVFLGKSKHMIFPILFETIKDNFRKPDYTHEDCVFDLTAAHAFTKGIKKALNIDFKISNNKEEIFHSLDAVKNANIKYYGNENWNFFHGDVMEHLVATENWKTEYISWYKQMEEFINDKNS